MGRFRVAVGMDIKKASNHKNKMLVAQSERVTLAQIVRTPDKYAQHDKWPGLVSSSYAQTH